MGRRFGRTAYAAGVLGVVTVLAGTPAMAQTPTATIVGPTSTATPVPTGSVTPTATPTPTPTQTIPITPGLPTATATATPTATPTPTPTPLPAANAAYQCYAAKVTPKTPRFARRDAALADALGDVTAKVRKVAALCNPAGVAGGAIDDPTAHLTCYGVKEPKRPAKGLPEFAVTDAFGALTLDVQKAIQLCLPAEKDGVASELGDAPVHCWKARVAPGTTKFTARSVALADQFGAATAEAKKPAALCLATSVDGVPASDPSAALVCYALKAPKTSRQVTTSDAFGALALTVRRPTLLCLDATAQPAP